MREGLYEQVVTRAVEDAIARLSGLEARRVDLDTGAGPTTPIPAELVQVYTTLLAA